MARNTSLFVYISCVERGGDVSLFKTLPDAVRAALSEAYEEYGEDEEEARAAAPEELLDAEAYVDSGNWDAAIHSLDAHYENNGVDDEFIIITRAPLPGYSEPEPVAAE